MYLFKFEIRALTKSIDFWNFPESIRKSEGNNKATDCIMMSIFIFIEINLYTFF